MPFDKPVEGLLAVDFDPGGRKSASRDDPAVGAEGRRDLTAVGNVARRSVPLDCKARDLLRKP